MTGELWNYRAKAIRAIDGDTIRVRIDLGFRISHDIDVRLANVDCPELRRGTLEEREAGKLARDAAQRWLDSWASTEWPLTVTTGRGRSFNRWVGTIKAGGESLSEHLVELGHAIERL